MRKDAPLGWQRTGASTAREEDHGSVQRRSETTHRAIMVFHVHKKKCPTSRMTTMAECVSATSFSLLQCSSEQHAGDVDAILLTAAQLFTEMQVQIDATYLAVRFSRLRRSSPIHARIATQVNKCQTNLRAHTVREGNSKDSRVGYHCCGNGCQWERCLLETQKGWLWQLLSGCATTS